MLLLRKCAINEASRQCYVKILSFGMTTERCAKATSKVVFVELKLARPEVIKLCLLRCLRTSLRSSCDLLNGFLLIHQTVHRSRFMLITMKEKLSNFHAILIVRLN